MLQYTSKPIYICQIKHVTVIIVVSNISIQAFEKFLAKTYAAAQQVQVFKTDIHTQAARQVIIEALEEYPQVCRCTIDIEDCDGVLRLAGTLNEDIIIRTVQQYGFEIEELPG